eukprot:COSAG06_NODE_7686_length_2412_cov_1.354365_3_plen_85_part_00
MQVKTTPGIMPGRKVEKMEKLERQKGSKGRKEGANFTAWVVIHLLRLGIDAPVAVQIPYRRNWLVLQFYVETRRINETNTHNAS